jgi:hypothetical protein
MSDWVSTKVIPRIAPGLRSFFARTLRAAINSQIVVLLRPVSGHLPRGGGRRWNSDKYSASLSRFEGIQEGKRVPR